MADKAAAEAASYKDRPAALMNVKSARSHGCGRLHGLHVIYIK